MIDTCQAESMFQKFYSPNILSVASSKVGEDSLSVSGAAVCSCVVVFNSFLLSQQTINGGSLSVGEVLCQTPTTVFMSSI